MDLHARFARDNPKYRNAETSCGPVTGWVYVIAIGHPYVTHVKVGYTAKRPEARLRDLQTGCPFKMTLLGYCAGCMGLEADLHLVMQDDRCLGEWFVYTEFVDRVISDHLSNYVLYSG